MSRRIVVGDGVLPATADVLRGEVSTLRRTLDDLDGYLRTLSVAWSGAAATSFRGQLCVLGRGVRCVAG